MLKTVAITDKKLRLLELDGLRGVACIFVVLFHYLKYLNHAFSFKYTFPLGVTGVDLFFLISGFVIYMTLTKTKSIGGFVVSRFSRLYPVFWFAVSLTTLFCILFSFGIENISVKGYFANMTMLPAWFKAPLIDNSYWTLLVELQFYFIIAFFYFGLQKFSVLSKSIFLLVLLIMINAASIYYNTGKKIIYFLPIIGFWGLFFSGILFYKMKVETVNRPVYYLLHFLNLGFVYLTHSQAGVSQYYTTAWQHTIADAGYMLIFYLFVLDKLRFLASRVFVFLGNISYSVYLLHQTIGYILINTIQKIVSNSYFTLAIVLLLILVLSYFTNIYIEKPLMKWFRNALKPKKLQAVSVMN